MGITSSIILTSAVVGTVYPLDSQITTGTPILIEDEEVNKELFLSEEARKIWEELQAKHALIQQDKKAKEKETETPTTYPERAMGTDTDMGNTGGEDKGLQEHLVSKKRDQNKDKENQIEDDDVIESNDNGSQVLMVKKEEEKEEEREA